MNKEIEQLIRVIFTVYVNHPDYISTDRVPTLEDCQKFIEMDDRLTKLKKLAKLTFYPWEKIVSQVGDKVNRFRKYYVTTEELVSMIESGSKPLLQITETDDEDFPAGIKFRVLATYDGEIEIDAREFAYINEIFYEEPEDESDASTYKWFHLSSRCNMNIGRKKFHLLTEGAIV